MTTPEPVWELDGLTVEVKTSRGWTPAVSDVSLTVHAGEILGLVGESGSGKTITATASLGLAPTFGARIAGGRLRICGRDVLTLGREELRQVRARDASMIFQESRRALDPAFSVGAQIAGVVRAHEKVSRRVAWERAVEMLDLVQIAEPARRARQYPHTFSGGMAQRVMLAMALACHPKVLIADEPTTALDVTVQERVLQLITELQAKLGLAVVLITHDLAVVSSVCDRVAVMYAGEIVEHGPTRDLYLAPKHPYTAGLLAALPQLGDRSQLSAIAGQVPVPGEWPAGCRFLSRCAHADDGCRRPIVLTAASGDREVRCVRHADLRLQGAAQ